MTKGSCILEGNIQAARSGKRVTEY